MSSLTLLRMTDKWSKRSFSAKLSHEVMPKTIRDLLTLLARLTRAELQQWYKKKIITQESIAGVNDIQQALFTINDDGSLGDRIEQAEITYNGMQLPVSATVPLELYQSQTREAEMYLADLVIDRDSVAYRRNWRGYYRRNWRGGHTELITSWLQREYGDHAQTLLAPSNPAAVEQFIRCIAQNIYSAPYELYSRYLGRGVPFKSANETLDHIREGRGGNCSEKASAIDFICTNFGIKSRLCLSGNNASGPFPEFHLRKALERSSTVFTGDKQRYWEHFANSIIVNDERWLCDATGGPMPFLFCKGSEADTYFRQKRSLPVKFIARDENFFYHDAPTDISYGALFNMEVFLPDIDMYHIFGAEGEDEPFGLAITPEWWICPNAYRSEDEYEEHYAQWRSYAAAADRIRTMAMYKNLEGAEHKELLTAFEADQPSLIADLRAIEKAFVKRCRYVWRDERWSIGYVFCHLKRPVKES